MDRYEKTIHYLYSQLPVFQRTGKAAYKADLGNTLVLDEWYEQPHHSFKTIHVGGTNGKGSVSHMLASVLQEAGYRVGLYTSPHLKDFRERIRVNGVMMARENVVEFVDDFQQRNAKANIEPSFFELTVAMAFWYFRKCEVDVAVIEVGLGGRLDSTNVIQPELAVITNISLDHVALLGDRLDEIAAEKAGIIKPGVPVVIGERNRESAAVFIQKAMETGSSIHFADEHYASDYSLFSPDGKQVFQIKSVNQIKYENLELGLLGTYQGKNCCTALASIDLLNSVGFKVEEKALRDGLCNVVSNTGLLGRWQVIGANPRIVCDTGHNEAGISYLVKQIAATPYKRLHFVFGMVNDKNIEGVLAMLPQEATYYFTKASIPRALDEKELLAKAEKFNLNGDCFSTVDEALCAAKACADKDDFIFIGGSTFVVAEVV